MRLPPPLNLVSWEGLQVWARSMIVSILTSWGVEHDEDGTHRFPWVDIRYAAALFGAVSGLTWTVQQTDVMAQRYRVVGKTLDLVLDIQNTSTSGSAGTYFWYRLPDGMRAAARMGGPCAIADNGTAACGWWVVHRGEDIVRFYRDPQVATNWSAASSNNTTVVASMSFEVE